VEPFQPVDGREAGFGVVEMRSSLTKAVISLQRVAMRDMVQNLRMSNLSNFSAMICRSVNLLMQQPLFSTSREI